MFEDQTQAAVRGLVELGEALLTGGEGLFTKTSNATVPLRDEADKLLAEAGTLTESVGKLRPISEAKVRLLLHQVDERLAAGDTEVAERLRAEAKALEDNLQASLDRGEACRSQARELASRMRAAGPAAYAEAYPQIRVATVEVCRAVVALLDTVHDGLVRHAAEYGCPVKHMDLADLTPREHGSERTIFQGLLRWFGGRR